MAHMIEKMAYRGETPWHRLGVVFDDNVRTARAALGPAGLDWIVDTSERALANINGFPVPIADKFAVLRKRPDGTTIDCIGVVGRYYDAIQNEQLADWCDALSQVSEGKAIIETAGSLAGGRRVWFLMRYNGAIKLPGDASPIDKYLLVASSHDGTMNCRIQLTPVRVVCNNTLSVSLGVGKRADKLAKGAGGIGIDKASNVISIRHTTSATDRLDAAVKALADADGYFDSFTKLGDMLTRTPFSSRQWGDLVKILIPTEDESKVPTRTKNSREQLEVLWDTTPGAMPGTAWGAIQAVTDYADHHAAVRGKDELATAERRAILQFTPEFKQNALDLVLAATKEQWGAIQLSAIADKTAGNGELLDDILDETMNRR